MSDKTKTKNNDKATKNMQLKKTFEDD